MSNKPNYQRALDGIIHNLQQKRPEESSAQGGSGTGDDAPRLLLHSCCAPCSSYVLEYLSDYFVITDFFYNPNIAPEEEYRYREEELKRLIGEMHPKYAITFVAGKYDPERFYETVRGLEHIHEGGERCFACYRLRMEEAALLAAKG
jgi:predicted adenine nucleotide alpha hydrolase (AANH) superfamily ATPase